MSTEERRLKAMEFIKEACPNHIREYSYRQKEGTYWSVSRLGMVWYDPDSDHATFQEAFEALVQSKPPLRAGSGKDRLEVEMQKLRGDLHEANLALQKALLYHVEERAKLEERIKELEAR